MSKLIGTGANQVPTNADLGSMAYIDKEGFTAKISDATLAKIDKNSDYQNTDYLAIYSTAEDSDGGAWTEKATSQSWYHEDFSAVRGSKKAFPKLVGLQVDDAYLKIFDLDKEDAPLWMHISCNTDFPNYGLYGASLRKAEGKNGWIVCGSNERYMIIDFIKDEIRWASDTTSALSKGIANREGSAAVRQEATERYLPYASDGNMYDLAVTVLENAPVDEYTGLPRPTIALAMAANGISVISDDLKEYNQTLSGNYSSNAVEFNGQDLMCVRDGGASNYTHYYIKYPEYLRDNGDRELIIKRHDATYPTGANYYLHTHAHSKYQGGSQNTVFAGDRTLWIKNSTSNTSKQTGTEFVGFYLDHENYNNSLTCRISEDYVSGWMPYDTRLCTMASTFQKDLTQNQLLSASGFSTTTGWNVSNTGTFTSNGSIATLVSTSYAGIYQGVNTFVVGKRYLFESKFDNLGNTTTMNLRVYNATTSPSGDYTAVTVTESNEGVITYSFIATNESMCFQLIPGGGGTASGTYTFDNARVREAIADRSNYANNVSLIGNLEKAAVADNAELAAFGSNWGASTYAYQPYNPDLDFGTGDFTVMTWFRSDIDATHELFSRGEGSNTSMRLLVRQGNPDIKFQINQTSNVVGYDVQNQTWTHICCARKNGIVTLYVDGELISTNTNGGDASSGTNPNLYFGINYDGSGNTMEGKMALAKISGASVTHEMVRKIYEDEKMLFQEGAQCSVYGGGDGVSVGAVIAYDQKRDLVHFGSEHGRSVFSGLRRIETVINNDNEGTTRSIAAYDGLVLED